MVPREKGSIKRIDKCKELRISFAKEQRAFDPVLIEGKDVELVTSSKLLGLTIANDLT